MATLAVFLPGSNGNLPLSPVIFEIVTEELSVSLTMISSPGLSMANPKTSNPHPTLPTDAGANTLTVFARLNHSRNSSSLRLVLLCCSIVEWHAVMVFDQAIYFERLQ